MLSKVAASFFSSPVCFYASERLLLACVTWFVRRAACVHAHHTHVCVWYLIFVIPISA